jgi:flagellar motor switch protein FliM
MSDASVNNLNRENNRRLLSAIGSRPAETSEIKAVEYNWRQGRYFNTEQLKQLDNFTKQAAATLTEKFTALFHSDFYVTTVSTTQHFACELTALISNSGQADYYLAFGPNKDKPLGLIAIPAQTASLLVSLLLGDTKAPDKSGKSERNETGGTSQPVALSQLEESLLFDIAKTVAQSISICFRGYYEVQPAKSMAKGKPPIEFQSIEEICKIVFGTDKDVFNSRKDSSNTELRTPNSETTSAGTQIYILIPCSKLAPVVGKTVEVERELSAGDISKAILHHLQQMPVCVKVRLASTALTLEQIISLRQSDIVLLDKPVDEPVELLVNGRTLFHGRPVKSAGQYAVVIQKTNDR